MERQYISLTIVGNGDFSDYKKEFAELENVTIVNRWIKDEEVGSFFSGNNIVTVLPYNDAAQSGVIPMSYVGERKKIEQAYEFNKSLDWITLANKLKSII